MTSVTQEEQPAEPAAPRSKTRVSCGRCHRRIRLTQAGTFYAHKPYTRGFSGEMVPQCAAGGQTPQWAKGGVPRETK